MKRNESPRHPDITKPTAESSGHVNYVYWHNKIHNPELWNTPIPRLAYNFWNSDPSAFQLSGISTDDRNLML